MVDSYSHISWYLGTSTSNLGCIQYFQSISSSGVVGTSLLSIASGVSIAIWVIGVVDGIWTSGGMSCCQSVYHVHDHISQSSHVMSELVQVRVMYTLEESICFCVHVTVRLSISNVV